MFESRLKTAREPGSSSTVVFPSFKGLLLPISSGTRPKPSRRAMIMLQKEFILKRTTNEKLAAREHVSRMLLASQKGRSTLWLIPLFN